MSHWLVSQYDSCIRLFLCIWLLKPHHPPHLKRASVYFCMTGIMPCLTHWGRVTHICVSKLTITGSDNGLSPKRHQAIIWTNAGILLIGLLGTNFSEILTGIQTFSFKKMHLKVSSAKCRPFCLGLNVVRKYPSEFIYCKHLWTWTALVWQEYWHIVVHLKTFSFQLLTMC